MTEIWVSTWGHDVDELVANFQRFEAAGVHGVSFSDSQNLWFDTWVALTLAARETERIKLGPIVTSPMTFHPTMTQPRDPECSSLRRLTPRAPCSVWAATTSASRAPSSWLGAPPPTPATMTSPSWRSCPSFRTRIPTPRSRSAKASPRPWRDGRRELRGGSQELRSTVQSLLLDEVIAALV